jgi:translation elongation factor EF-G
MQGRKAVEVPELHAGDLGAVAKLRETLTGDTLGVKGAEIQVEIFHSSRAGHDLRHRAQIPRRRR